MTLPSLHDIMEAVCGGALAGLVLWFALEAWEHQLMIGAV